MTMNTAQARLSKQCSAPAEVVYDLLTDLRSHLEWGGARQSADFRLLSMEGPRGAAVSIRVRDRGQRRLG